MVVGYQTYELVSGVNVYVPTFKSITGGKLLVQDIKVSGDQEDYSTSIQVLNSDGISEGEWTWINTLQGWYDMELGLDGLIDKELTEGKAIYIKTGEVNAKITVTGGVSFSPLVLTVGSGVTITGNATANPINIQDIKVSGDQEDYSTSIQVLNSDGISEGEWTWINTLQGWYDMELGLDGLISETILPGKGIYIKTSEAQIDITLPNNRASSND